MSTIELLRQYKLGSFSVIDFAGSLVIVYVAAPLLIRVFRVFRVQITRASLLWFTVPLSVMVHALVGAWTPLTRMVLLGTDNIIAKLCVLGMLIAGFRGVRILRAS